MYLVLLIFNPKKNGIFNSFKALTICFDLVPKSLYSFISTSEEIIFFDLISTQLDKDGIPKGKVINGLKTNQNLNQQAFY